MPRASIGTPPQDYNSSFEVYSLLDVLVRALIVLFDVDVPVRSVIGHEIRLWTSWIQTLAPGCCRSSLDLGLLSAILLTLELTPPQVQILPELGRLFR